MGKMIPYLTERRKRRWTVPEKVVKYYKINESKYFVDMDMLKTNKPVLI
jgi:hypothetical protein